VKSRFMPLTLGMLAAVLSACTSSVGTSSTTPVVYPSAPPSFNLSGTRTQYYTYDYGYPSPEPPSTITTNVTANGYIAEETPPPGFPSGSTQDVHVTETAATSLETQTTVDDAYVGSQGGNVVLFGLQSNQEVADGGQSTKISEIPGTPTIIVGSGTWTNSPAAVIHETYSDGHYYDRTIASDGTYKEKGTAQSGQGDGFVPILLKDESSGAGVYSGPFSGAYFGTLTFDFDEPAGTPPTIGNTITTGTGHTYPGPPIPAWFDANPTFYSDHDSLTTGVKAPSSCGLGSVTTNRVTHIETLLDTVIGYTETIVTNDYSPGTVSLGGSAGSVCTSLNDTLDNYYDWNRDYAEHFPVVSPDAKPISEVVTTEVLTTASSNAASPRAHAARTPISAAFSNAIVAGVHAHFYAQVERQRETYLRAMRERHGKVAANGGVR